MEQLILKLPQVASAITAPLSKTDKMVFINTGDGSGGKSGKSDLVKSVTQLAAEVPVTLEALTGVNVAEVLAGVSNSQTGLSAIQGAAEGVADSLTKQRLTRVRRN